MAKRVVLSSKDLVEEALGFEGESEAEDFEAFLTEVGPGISVIEIFRMLRDGNREQLERVGFDLLREDAYGYLRETHGPGKYMLVFKDGQKKYRGAKTLNVGGKITTAVEKPTTNGNGDLVTFLREQMLMQQQTMNTLLASMRPPPPPPPVDVGSMMTGMAALLTAVNSGQVKQDPSAMMKNMVDAFVAMKPTVKEDPIESATKILDLVNAVRGDSGGKEDTVWSVVKDVGKEIAGRMLTAAPVATEAAVVVPPPNQNPGEEQVFQRKPSSLSDFVKVGLAYLKEKAKLGKDPEFWVDSILENAEEGQWAALLEAIDKGATFEHLLQFDPEIAQNAQLTPWFRTVYDGLHAEVVKHLDTERSSGNENDPGANEKPVQTGSLPAGDTGAS